jgi:hypothetical protein
MKEKRIKTAILVDMMGSGWGEVTPEQEVETLTARFSELVAPAELDVYEPKHAGEGKYGIQPGTELVLYDFGGLMPGSSLMEDNARQIVKWAEDHPSSLVVVVSLFTFTHFVEIEVRERGLDELPNVVCDVTEGTPIPEWFAPSQPIGSKWKVGKLQTPGRRFRA